MITPIEIRQNTFKKALRGFDKEEVQNFLNTLSIEWEKVLGEMKSLKTELDKTKTQLDSLKQVENVLHKTLQQAEETSRSTMENAKKNAELRLQEAEAKKKDILGQAMEDKSRIEIEINELISYRNELLQQMKLFVNSQNERLKSFEEREMKPEKKASMSSPSPRLQKVDESEGDDSSFFKNSLDEEDDSNVINEIAEGL